MLNSLLETSSLVQNDSSIIGLWIISIVLFLLFLYVYVKNLLNEQNEDSPTSQVTLDAEPQEVPGHIIDPDTVTARSVEKLMSYLQNGEGFDRMVREDIEDAKRNKSIVFSSATMVALTLIHTCVSISLIAKSKTRDKNYHICHSNYAILDFCIYSYFLIRKGLLVSVSRSKIEKMDSDFLSLLPTYFNKRFGIRTDIAESILDKRIDAYEALIASHNEEEITFALFQYILNDFNKTPLSEGIILISPDIAFNLNSEITALFNVCKVSFLKNASKFDMELLESLRYEMEDLI